MSKIKNPEITFEMNRILKEDCEFVISKMKEEGIDISFDEFLNQAIGNYVDKYYLGKFPIKEKVCPKCGKKVFTHTAIEREFGWRNVGDKNIPQSHCRVCRNEGQKEVKTNNPLE